MPAAVELLSALLTPVIALLAVCIAFQQYRVSRDKLRLDLYEKRYTVYVAARDLIDAVRRKATVSLPDIQAFDIGSAEIDFLFGPRVKDFLTELRRNAVRMHCIPDKLENIRRWGGGGQIEVVTEKEKILTWFLAQSEVAVAVFRKDLGFEQLRQGWARKGVHLVWGLIKKAVTFIKEKFRGRHE